MSKLKGALHVAICGLRVRTLCRFYFYIFCQILYLHFGGKGCKFWNKILESSHPCKYPYQRVPYHLNGEIRIGENFFWVNFWTPQSYQHGVYHDHHCHHHYRGPLWKAGHWKTYPQDQYWLILQSRKKPCFAESHVSLEYISYILTEVWHSSIFIIVVNVTLHYGNYPIPWQDQEGTSRQPCTSSVNRMKDKSLHFEGEGGTSP